MEMILVVDDETQACENMRKILAKKGYSTGEAHNGKEALEAVAEKEPELVLLDVRMPVMNGIEALRLIKEKWPLTGVIMVSALSELTIALECMKAGASGYLTKPVQLDALFLEIERASQKRALQAELTEHQENLEKKVAEKTEQTRKLYTALHKSFFEAVRVSVDCLQLYDSFLGAHSKRVAVLAGKVGGLFNLDAQRLENLEIAGYLHDIATLGIPARIRNSHFEILSENEISLIKRQTIITQEALMSVERFTEAGKIIRSHLEHVNGSGFPDHMKNETLTLDARILGVVNAYDEMKHRRRFATELEFAGKEDTAIAADHLREFAEKKFDPQVVTRLLDMLDEERMQTKNIRAFSIMQLKPGMRLAETLIAQDGKKLLVAGTELTPLLLNKVINYHAHVSPLPKKIYITN